MQQEDDLRGLARVMDFMRAVSILFVGINVYWFCYSTLKEWGVTFEVIDKILWNFQRTTGLFCRVVFPELVVAGTSAATHGGCRVLYLHAVGGLYLYAHGGYVDVPAVEKQPHG